MKTWWQKHAIQSLACLSANCEMAAESRNSIYTNQKKTFLSKHIPASVERRQECAMTRFHVLRAVHLKSRSASLEHIKLSNERKLQKWRTISSKIKHPRKNLAQKGCRRCTPCVGLSAIGVQHLNGKYRRCSKKGLRRRRRVCCDGGRSLRRAAQGLAAPPPRMSSATWPISVP